MNTARVLFIATLIVVCGCNKKSDPDQSNSGFDQSAMLINMADNLIVPAYEELSHESDLLVSTITTFAGTPNTDNLSAVQTQFKVAYKAYIHCEPYDFGPANGTVMLINSVNYWPTKPSLINNEISGNAVISNDYVNSLGAEKKGFPALGYLLFDITNGNAAVLDSFVTGDNAGRRKLYVQALAQNIAGNVKTVLQEWQGSYAATFKKNTGTELNTSLSLLLNNFVINFETSKNKRIGTPIGRKDNFTTGPVDPAAVELPYTDFAKDILAETAATLLNLYQGKSSAGDGPGFDDYVKSLNSDGAALNESIKTEFNVFQTDIAAINSPMQTSIQTDVTPVYNSWVQSKKLLVLLKVDLAANLGILITFSDNDGD
jgi:predicted lipoprotein